MVSLFDTWLEEKDLARLWAIVTDHAIENCTRSELEEFQRLLDVIIAGRKVQ